MEAWSSYCYRLCRLWLLQLCEDREIKSRLAKGWQFGKSNPDGEAAQIKKYFSTFISLTSYKEQQCTV
jgi:hypothetical protein